MTEVQSPSGVLLIDKPRGITSHDVVSRLRRAFNMQRIGHAGTLDPDATGLLILCLGKATKLSMTLSEKDKTYRVGFLLGKETDTYDSVGQVLAERPVNATREAVESVLQGFVGTQVQRPPIYSAVKVKGRKLYEYARAGKPVEIPTRHVTIHSIQLLRLEGAEGEIEVACSKGTY
ncbi:MAG TPA: tRNA pseudouridine(55) synthase TruB, partial [Bdellovibrionota bacterium]|nr:tRNA pseudouridine(55) synthase TruB [Bdellovibrionota bacterium]